MHRMALATFLIALTATTAPAQERGNWGIALADLDRAYNPAAMKRGFRMPDFGMLRGECNDIGTISVCGYHVGAWKLAASDNDSDGTIDEIVLSVLAKDFDRASGEVVSTLMKIVEPAIDAQTRISAVKHIGSGWKGDSDDAMPFADSTVKGASIGNPKMLMVFLKKGGG